MYKEYRDILHKMAQGQQGRLEKYVVFTGCTSGIGLSLIKQFVEHYHNEYKLHVCVTCRNMSKGSDLRRYLLSTYDQLSVHVVKLDTSSVQCTLQACRKIRELYPRLDVLYLNAGIMPVSKINWRALLCNPFSQKMLHMFKTGEGLLQFEDEFNEEGVKKIFATNVLGHHVMVGQLTEMMARTVPNYSLQVQKLEQAKIIWTSSTTANKQFFDINDVTCSYGSQPYASSKFVVNAIACRWNDEFNNKGISSFIVDPGTVITNILAEIFPWIILYLVIAPLFWLLRLFIPRNNIFPSKATAAMLQAFEAAPRPNVKLCSNTTFLNRSYVTEQILEIDQEEAGEIFARVSDFADELVEELGETRPRFT